MCEIGILGLRFSESSEMTRLGCSCPGIMKYNICEVSFGAFVQTIYTKEELFSVWAGRIFGKRQRSLHVPLSPGS